MFKLSITDQAPAAQFHTTKPITFHLWFEYEKDALAILARAHAHAQFSSFDLDHNMFPQWPETEIVKKSSVHGAQYAPVYGAYCAQYAPVYEWSVAGFSRYLDRLEHCSSEEHGHND